MKRTTGLFLLFLIVSLEYTNCAPIKRETTGWWQRSQNALMKLRAVVDGLLRAGTCFGAAFAEPCPGLNQARDPMGRCRSIPELILELEMLLDRNNPGRKNEIELVSANDSNKIKNI